MLRLTPSQYNSTVRDVLADATKPGDLFSDTGQQTVAQADVEAYWTAAKALGKAASTNATLIGCDPSAAGCAEQFIQNFGSHAFRRPIDPTEAARYKKVFDDGGGAAAGIDAVVESVLMSAPFLYRPEFGQAGSGAVKLTSWEIASRLSYFILGSSPDEALFVAAQSDLLQDKAKVREQANRLMLDPRAHEAVAQFHSEWLSLSQLAAITKDPTVYPNWNDSIRDAMVQETKSYMETVFWQGTVGDIFTTPQTWLNKPLADFYGIAGPSGDAFQLVSTDGNKRIGLLTQGGFLAIEGHFADTNPVGRGKFVRVGLMCEVVSPPPPGAAALFPELQPGQTTRQRFEAHETAGAACAGCHTLMDPIGLAFENYDGIGQWRDTQNGQPIDASGNIIGSDVEGEFQGPAGLAPKLAASQEVRACLAAHWFKFALARPAMDEDACSFKTVMDDFGAANYKLQEIIPALTQSDAFLYRTAVVPGGR
jgi:hypothetical protein